ncbi:MAG: ribonuclease Y [Chloroflexi bacterium]|nr:ribonuclease Y [Chloroflexota bacterium]
MDLILTAVITALVIAIPAGAIGFYLRNTLLARSAKAALEAAQEQIRRAEERSKEILLEAKEEAIKARTALESELRARRQELQKQEQRLEQREENLERRSSTIDSRESRLRNQEAQADKKLQELETLKTEETRRLESLSGLTISEAKDLLLRRAEEGIQFELARRIRDAEQQFHDQADALAREIVAGSIQRLASEVVSEATISSVQIPNDEMKGRLIGREGRNIRAIEAATGVDLIIDDTPETVTISCFDPIRREVARRALEKLIQDGRIHPARIEELVQRSQTDVNEVIRKAGEQAMLDSGVKGLHPELIKMMGRLKYRYSYGENVLQHCVEVSLLSSLIASELGGKVNVARTAGFLHDIGKALTHEVEGPHAEIGADLVAKDGMPDEMQKAIREHHDREMTTVESFVVAAADAISAARPGARRDTVEHYIQRLEALENVARGFPGVERCYAIQAGREIRVMVKPEEIDDSKAAVLARDIVKRIEETLAYPGQIKVVVIRESRTVEFAR